MRIRKGDTVQVLSGKNRGKRGQVMVAMPQVGKVIVDGANMAKRHTKQRGATMQGGIIDKAYEIITRSNLAQPKSPCGSNAVASAWAKDMREANPARAVEAAAVASISRDTSRPKRRASG